MARPDVPTIPDNKVDYYRKQLVRELTNIFKWEGLPENVPMDYLERNLITHGYVLFYEDDEIGKDILRCEVTGYNRHELPVSARTFTPNTVGERTTINRNLRYLSESEEVASTFNPSTDGVLIQNMYFGQNMWSIIEHFAYRLALAQQAFDTNLLWANVPYIFQTTSNEMKLSIEKVFNDIFTGKPFIVVDKELLKSNEERAGVPSGIQFIGKELIDVQNEIMMKFRETVGFNTAGVDKAERVNTLEIKSNDQHTESVINIMKYQRERACETINKFFNTNISVTLVGGEKAIENDLGDGDEYGTGDSGIEALDR